MCINHSVICTMCSMPFFVPIHAHISRLICKVQNCNKVTDRKWQRGCSFASTEP